MFYFYNKDSKGDEGSYARHRWRLRRLLQRVLCFLAAAGFFSATPVHAQGKITYATGAEVLAMFPKKYTPSYPYEARRSRLQGTGIFRMYIAVDGEVTRVGVVKSTGHKLLDINAAYGLIHWRAKPGRKREIDMPVTFTMVPPRRAR